jgi:hypothetical protein
VVGINAKILLDFERKTMLKSPKFWVIILFLEKDLIQFVNVLYRSKTLQFQWS